MKKDLPNILCIARISNAMTLSGLSIIHMSVLLTSTGWLLKGLPLQRLIVSPQSVPQAGPVS